MSERIVEITCRLLQRADGNVNARGTHLRDALSADERIRIPRGDNTSPNTGCDERVSTRTGAAMVAARLERDVGAYPY